MLTYEMRRLLRLRKTALNYSHFMLTYEMRHLPLVAAVISCFSHFMLTYEMRPSIHSLLWWSGKRSLISCLHMRCDSRNCANFTAPLFSFCCIRSHVCSEMASSPLMGCDFWCEPSSISMYTYSSHPVRICEPWLCLSATSA